MNISLNLSQKQNNAQRTVADTEATVSAPAQSGALLFPTPCYTSLLPLHSYKRFNNIGDIT